MEPFDLVVIGGGPGGYPTAIRAAQLGVRVALVEQEALGGTCLNWGCIPTKTLIASADFYWQARQATELGIAIEKIGVNAAAVAERKTRVVRKLRQGVRQLLQSHGVRIFEGTASFLTRNRVSVLPRDGAPATVLETRNTVIATGSATVWPGFLPRHPRVVSSREFLELERIPDRLIVLGGGVIGCELAALSARLGTQVTVVELLPDILNMLDAEVRREFRRHAEKALTIRFLTGKPLEDVAADDQSVRGRVGDETLQAEMLLCAVGRRPMTDSLNVEKAGLKLSNSGGIPVDEYGQTPVPGVWAVGDCTVGSTQLAHAATSHGLGVAENIGSGRRRKLETIIPIALFTRPEIGAVGLTEDQVRERGLSVATGRFRFAALGKALTTGEPYGFVKWVARADTGQLLGAHAVGPHATELIAEAAVAIRAELTAEELAHSVHCHPTFAEAWMEAAHAVHGRCVHLPPPRRPS